MRKLILLFFPILSVAYAQAQPAPVFNSKDSTVITGVIKFHDASKDEKMISFRVKDLAGKSIPYTALISDDGSFRCSLLQPYAGNFGVVHKRIYVELYGEPGEKIGLTINNNKIDSTDNLPAIFQASGKSSSISNGILLFTREEKLLPEGEQISAMGSNKSLSDEIFVEKMRSEYQKGLIRVARFLEKYKLKDNMVLQNWLINKITYSIAFNIVFNPFLAKRNPTMTPARLAGFLNFLPLYREGAFQNSEYYRFLSSYSGGIQICVNTNPDYRLAIKTNGNNAYPVYANQIDSLQLPPAIREMLYYDSYSIIMSNSVSDETAIRLRESFDRAIQTKYLRNEMLLMDGNKTENAGPVDIIGKIRNFKTTEPVKQHLISILETATKNRYAFIDFWGSWCAPCMAEMPYYPAFIDTIHNKPVDFLFLSLQTSEADAKQAKEKFGINASFINLSDDEINVLNQVFGFTSYPSHFVLAPGGMMLGRYEESIASATRNRTAIVKEPIHLFSLIK